MSIDVYNKSLSARDKTILARVQSEFFAHSPILFDQEITQSVNEEETELTLGCRAGPSLEIFNLLHEMSHLVEIDDKRILKYGWSLYFGRQVNIPGFPSFNEPENWKATQRELRVMAYQANLMAYYGMKPDFIYLASLCDYLVDYLVVPIALKNRHAVLAKRLEKLSKQKKYSVEAFKKEWERKNQLLRQRQVKRKRAA